MKKKIVFIVLIFLTSSFSINIFSQIIDKGEISYGIIGWTLKDNNILDSIRINKIATSISEKLPQKIIFNQNYLVIMIRLKDEEDILARSVYNIKNNKVYLFNETSKEYVIDSISDNNSFLMDNHLKNYKIINEEKLSNRKFGLKVKAVTLKFNNVPTKFNMIISPDVKIPDIKMFRDINMGIDGLLLSTKIEIPEGTIEMGVTNFTTEISEIKYLSTSLDGYINANEKINKNDENKSEEDGMESFSGVGENLNLVKQLRKDQILKDGILFRYTKFEALIKYNASIDLVSILIELMNNGTAKINNSKDSILKYVKMYKLLSEKNISKAYKIKAKYPDITIKEFWNSIILLALKEQLSSKSTRKIIFDNHIKLGLINSLNNSLIKDYISGKIDFSEFIVPSCPLLFATKNDFALSKNETIEVIKSFFNLALGDKISSILIKEKNDTILINTPNFEYTIPYNELREINYDKLDDENESYIYYDTINLNLNFYNKLLQIIKQINVDYSLNYSFSMYDFDISFFTGIDKYDYQTIINKIPSLRILKTKFALNRFLSKEYNRFGNIPISYKVHPSNIDEQIYIKGYKNGDYDNNKQYVSSSIKQNFIKSLVKNKIDYNINDSQILQIKKRIHSKLIIGEYSLLDYIPNFGYTYSIISDPYLVDPKYIPVIDSSKSDFKNIFTELDNFVNHKFKAINFTYDKKNRSFSFKFRNDIYSVAASELNMLTSMSRLLNSISFKSRIYELFNDYGPSKYCFLTINQKKDLENLNISLKLLE